jgi:hypothetical protein
MPVDQKKYTSKLVWYASYGSNLKRERFFCYIKGGTPQGSTRSKPYVGCRDKTDPIDSRSISLKFELYFAGQSPTWGNSGIAFIRDLENTEQIPALGRMYLITDEQFNDVVMQENSKSGASSRLVPDFQQLVSQKQMPLGNNLWYGKLLNVGSEGGYPILTFTTNRSDLKQPTAPSEQYIKVIASGIKETYPHMSDDDVAAYLLRADGLRGQVDQPKIRGWVAGA